MDLSIIIVNWNSAEFAKACIASLQSAIHDLDYEIVVVDNDSQDDSCRIISGCFPTVIVVPSRRNIGFARANNLGVEHSCGEYLLFLNPDTVVLDDAIGVMLSRLKTAALLRAVGCRLLNRDLSLQTSCVQAFPNLSNQILGIDWLKRRFPTLAIWGMRALFTDAVGSFSEVDAVSGACLMTTRRVFEQVGGFSTEYFMYAEEMDLCYKIRRAGWKIGYIPDAQIVHFGGQSSKKQSNVFADVVMHDSIFRFLKKFRGKVYAGLYRAAMLASAAVRLAILLPLLILPAGLVDREALRQTCVKWYRIGTWSLAQERWTAELGR